MLSAKQLQSLTSLLLHIRFFFALSLEYALKVVCFIVVERNVEFVACGLFECFLFGVLHQPDMLVLRSYCNALCCITFVCLQDLEETLSLVLLA
jgi:hypothetical protein